ncbi:hypothetical protein SUGI_0910400 [Cryptomeria japonica]|nr:hypothetical protein SUGI_0910400 [Cryptomeria japonica]
MYRGVRRRRWGKWVSEIREPGKKKRIWLGSYAMPEMAARAYDVAAVSLKGKSALPNFPHLINSLPRPASLHYRDIQLAAAEAAFSFKDSSNSTATIENGDGNSKDSSNSGNRDEEDNRSSFTNGDDFGEAVSNLSNYFDEGLCQFDSPNLVISMAEAPLLSPPRFDEVSGYVDGDSYMELETLGFLWRGF